MKKRILSFMLTFAMLCAFMPMVVQAEETSGDTATADYYFTDRSGNELMVPANAWVKSVVSFTPGDPWTSDETHMDENLIVGMADYKDNNGDLNLGAGGVIVVEFGINIYDGEGDDIYVFEVGPDVESTKVEVSNDLETWYDVGTAKGSTASVDLNGKVPDGSKFRYVRLTDLEHSYSRWPGADIDAVAGLCVKPITSDWSESIIDTAEEYGLIPDTLKNADMTQSITRAEFAAVSVKTYENLANTVALPATDNPFTDTTDTEVLKAYNAGIAIGVSDTEFAPNALLNREQAATMLTRVFKRATKPGWTIDTDSAFALDYTKPSAFSDDGNISDWAKDSVYFMTANGIINGMGDNTFAPKNITSEEEAVGYANATREQALAIAVRMVENFK